MKKLILLFVLVLIVEAKAVPQSCLPNGIVFSTQSEIDSFQTNFPGCTEIEGSVTILGDDITNLNGLNIITSIGYDLSVGEVLGEGNPRLISLAGLENLTSIGGSLSCANNDSLLNLTGLESLTHIEYSIWIHLNPRIENLNGLLNITSLGIVSIGGNNTLTSLSGLENLVSIYNLSIEANPALENLLSLTNLSQVNDIWIKDNPSLESLEGLENIDANSVEYLTITSNENLSTCEVQFVCSYISDSSNYAWIVDNALGCNSYKEVDSSCQVISISEMNKQPELLFYPNPTKGEIFFPNNNKLQNYEINIYTQLGEKVIHEKVINNKIDASKLLQGIYVIEVVSKNYRIRNKLVIKK